MGLWGSALLLLKSATGHYPEQIPSTSHSHGLLFKMHFNNTVQHPWLPHRYFVWVSHLNSDPDVQLGELYDHEISLYVIFFIHHFVDIFSLCSSLQIVTTFHIRFCVVNLQCYIIKFKSLSWYSSFSVVFYLTFELKILLTTHTQCCSLISARISVYLQF